MTPHAVLGALFLVASLARADAGVGDEVEPWIAEAVSWGAIQGRLEFPHAKGSASLSYSTPYLRVAMAAHAAKRKGRNLDPENIPDDLTSSNLHLMIEMLPIGTGGRIVGMAPATGVTLVVRDARLRPDALQTLARPMSVGVVGGDMQKFEAHVLKAVFPMSPPFLDQAEAVVQYSWLDNGHPKQLERSYRLDLKKVKWGPPLNAAEQ
jgi:hypothetical protein